MNSSKALEMLNNGRIEDLKKALQDEIYNDSLKGKPNAKKRYTAMKKYFTLVDNPREICKKPCEILYNGEAYNSFTNSYSLALTTESCGEIEMFDTANGTYPDISRLIDLTGPEAKIDISRVIAEAKSQGYKLKKSELFSNKYLMHYNGSYFRIALLDSTFSIVDDGEPVSVYHGGGRRGKLTIQTSIGIAVIMPVFMEDGPESDAVVIEAETHKQ